MSAPPDRSPEPAPLSYESPPTPTVRPAPYAWQGWVPVNFLLFIVPGLAFISIARDVMRYGIVPGDLLGIAAVLLALAVPLSLGIYGLWMSGRALRGLPTLTLWEAFGALCGRRLRTTLRGRGR